MVGTLAMNEDHRKDWLNGLWQTNEEKLARLGDLPAGPLDPTEVEAELDRDQDLIEGELGAIYIRETREARPGVDQGNER